jgi:outer membrane protein assembly factor BamB
LWSQAIDVSGAISPDVVSGTLYVGTDGKLLAINASAGSTLWQVAAGTIEAPPSVSNNVVYVTVGSAVVAYSATNGALKWQYTTGGTAAPYGPAVAFGNVYASSEDGYLYALGA